MRFPEILSIEPPPVFVEYVEKDSMLYALALGFGNEPRHPQDLQFVYEKALRVVPTMSAVLAGGAGEIIAKGDIDLRMVLHGEQRLSIANDLPPAGTVTARSRCLNVIDKGDGKGALVNIETLIADAATGMPYSTTIMTLFCRADGGFSGPSAGALPNHRVPARAPDRVLGLPTTFQQAALYRLTGDRNPLHIDPDVAAAAGFEQPVLHGLCTYGIACRAVLQAYCNDDPTLIRTFDARFCAPVYPGETVVTRIWRDDVVISFECVTAERGIMVISNGRCVLGR